MPYTPPSHSPTASPLASRRSSYSSSSGSLPRSASYLRKHRRSPSAPASAGTSTDSSPAHNGRPSSASSPSTKSASDSNGSLTSSSSNSVSSSTHNQQSSLPPSTTMATATMTMAPAPMGPITLSIPSSVRQSPPAVSSSHSMLAGVVLSPPESASDSDEDALEIRGRERQSLIDLKDNIRQTKMEVSPDIIAANPPSSKPGSPSFVLSHRRTKTEPAASTPRTSDNAIDTVDDETDTEIYKPKMVRKKSGELVRPALRASSRSRRVNSAPGTPVAFKAVHFDSQLEHVRHFAHQDRPAAVSAGTSPNEAYESETEFPFYETKHTSETPFSWEMSTKSFPSLSPYRKSQPICLERVWLSADQKVLHGSVAVANLSFQKLVVCRFTFDYWKTTSEVVADYDSSLIEKQHPTGTDRFNFGIRLSDTADLENKTMYFCVRYNVNGRDYWDNNSHQNFQVGFSKKYQKPAARSQQKGKPVQAFSSQTASAASGGLPRSHRTGASGHPSPPHSHHRSKSVPAGLGIDESKKPAQPSKKAEISAPAKINPLYLEDEPIALRLKQKRNISPESNGTSGFSNRYDFGASLNAARMEPSQKAKPKARVTKKEPMTFAPSTPVNVLGVSTSRSTVPGLSSNGPSAHSSYEELVNKWCFFSSKPAGSVLDNKPIQHSSPSFSQSHFNVTEPYTAPKNYDYPPSFGTSSPGYLSQSSFSQYASLAQHHNLNYGVPVSAPAMPSGVVPFHEAAIRCQKGMMGFPPKREQMGAGVPGMASADGLATPSTPGSSSSSSPTIMLASPASPMSPSAVIPMGMPVPNLSGKSLNEFEFATGAMHEHLHASATAISG